MLYNLVILMGPPGVGKGTLADLCVKELGFSTISTGQILRENVTKKTVLGLSIEQQMALGGLVADELVNGVVFDWLDQRDSAQPILLDGYPRTLEQAQALVSFLNKSRFKGKYAIFWLDAPAEVIKSRLLGRKMCPNAKCGKIYGALDGNLSACKACNNPLVLRADDNAGVILNRLQLYLNTKDGLLDFFVNKANLPMYTCDTAEISPTEVFHAFKNFA